jgi:hypothetical protein
LLAERGFKIIPLGGEFRIGDLTCIHGEVVGSGGGNATHAMVRSYKASGELTKVQVWRVLNRGQIECLTPGSSYKVKRVRRNPRVICYVGSKDGPAISGTAQIITDHNEVMRVYLSYWKVHPVRMAIVIGLRVWIEMLLNKRVVVRVQPDDPNPVAGLTDPA